ncbi:SpoIIE family protein phosphatase [Streptomyces sp. C8S0]|uniref:ATP-binding SpoIIE family protein phosphatase n=1 Tax=Streptomyces sp. C8S0 TaxID=2585716 RepID=UPI001D053713|nr:SpoIIE family protein phosphatase [Streptomyces sp. C8S0]
MTEQPTSHEGRQPLAARPQERTRPRREAHDTAEAPGAQAPPALPAAQSQDEGSPALPSQNQRSPEGRQAAAARAAAQAGRGSRRGGRHGARTGAGGPGRAADARAAAQAGQTGQAGPPAPRRQASGTGVGADASAPVDGEAPQTGAGRPAPDGSVAGTEDGPASAAGSGSGTGAGTAAVSPADHGVSAPGEPPPPTDASGSLPTARHEPVGTARREGDRLRFVGAATRRIARGLDLDEIVLGLCRATVPTFSDAILVYLRDPLPVGDERPVDPFVLRLRRTDRLRLTEEDSASDLGLLTSGPVVAPDAGEPSPAAELCEVQPGGPLAEVLRGVRPVFGDSEAARAALPELLGEGRTVPSGHRAVLAPLRGRRRVIGAAVFLRGSDTPPFEQNDLLVAAQLATHTALGIDKAVLYGREAYIADELQRTMLPENLPQPTGVKLASRYLPAAETARVGGDWYDAIPLPGSRVALVVGDVMGHSMTSAAIMGQLRTTAQTLAGLDLPPQEVLHHLDEQAQRLGENRMATCLYAVYDPVAHRITIANAGHPPPVLLHLGGRAEVLRVPPGAPIGVGGVDFEAVELDAPAGATLLLYTDGLVESRLRDVWAGIELLRERLAATAQLTGPDHSPPLEALCDDVLDMLGPGDRDDDIALLAARFDGIAPSDVAYWFLEPEDAAPGRARRLARKALTRWGLEDLTDSVELLVSEVVTNAVRYATRPVTLRLLRTDVLRCEVGDDSPQLPRQRRARDTDEGGRGLFLVNRLARRWGATRLSTGKVVWFELPTPV